MRGELPVFPGSLQWSGGRRLLQKNEFHRVYLMFENEDSGFESGQKPSGFVNIETRNGRGKLKAIVRNLKQNNNIFYKLNLINIKGKIATPVNAGTFKPIKNRFELEWTFDPGNVAMTGIGIDEFDVIAVMADTAQNLSSAVNSGISGYIDGDAARLACPLAAYTRGKKEWRKKLNKPKYPSFLTAEQLLTSEKTEFTKKAEYPEKTGFTAGSLSGMELESLPGNKQADLQAGRAGIQQESVPGKVHGIMPGAWPGIIPGTMQRNLPGQMPVTLPGAMNTGMPGNIPSGIPRTAPGAMTGPVPGAFPGAVPGPVPGVLPGAMHGNIPGGIAGNVTDSPPEKKHGSIPAKQPKIAHPEMRLLRKEPGTRHETAETPECIQETPDNRGQEIREDKPEELRASEEHVHQEEQQVRKEEQAHEEEIEDKQQKCEEEKKEAERPAEDMESPRDKQPAGDISTGTESGREEESRKVGEKAYGAETDGEKVSDGEELSEGGKIDKISGSSVDEGSSVDVAASENEQKTAQVYRFKLAGVSNKENASNMGEPVTGCYTENDDECMEYLSRSGINPCEICRYNSFSNLFPSKDTASAGHGKNCDIREPPGDINKLREVLYENFEISYPFKIKRSDYKWWKITDPVSLNNILNLCNIRTSLLFNPAVMKAHVKHRHLITGIYTDKENKKEYLVFGIPGQYKIDKRPFGDFCRWIPADGTRQRQGSFGYWLIYMEPETSKIMRLK